MVQDSSILEEDFIILMQTKSKKLERLLSNAIQGENIHLQSITGFADLDVKEQRLRTSQTIAFIIGSDVEDPIQSAQRFHAYKKNAAIILLSTSKNVDSLKEVIKFSPFIGTDVFCLDESKQAALETQLKQILKNSERAERYRNILAESSPEISLKASSQKSVLNQSFITKLMDVAPVGIAIVSRKGKVLGWNKEATLIFRKSEAQVLGTSLSGLFEPSEGNKLENYLSESFEKGRTSPEDPLSLKREFHDTSKQVLSFTAAPFTYSEGTEKALVLAIKDITQNIELLDQLKTEITARDNFLAMASHELRTPLTIMSINLDLLKGAIKQNFPGALDFLELNNKSLKQADRLNDLIEDLFDIAKIHAGKLDFNLEEFDLSEFVKGFVREMEQRFEEAGCELTLDIESKVIGVWDKDRVGQAFSNLISNTLKYAPGAPVNIVLETRGDWAHLSVRDQGPGISEDKQQKIFDRFERGIDPKTISGLGLGLFITKKIVEGHAGNIQVKSSLGKGSTFTLKLPLDLDPEKQPEDLSIHW